VARKGSLVGKPTDKQVVAAVQKCRNEYREPINALVRCAYEELETNFGPSFARSDSPRRPGTDAIIRRMVSRYLDRRTAGIGVRERRRARR
jgi:hypothetical protein